MSSIFPLVSASLCRDFEYGFISSWTVLGRFEDEQSTEQNRTDESRGDRFVGYSSCTEARENRVLVLLAEEKKEKKKGRLLSTHLTNQNNFPLATALSLSPTQTHTPDRALIRKQRTLEHTTAHTQLQI